MPRAERIKSAGVFSSWPGRRLTHLAAGAAQCGANAVFGHADSFADFLIGLAFEVVHAHYLGFIAIEFIEQAGHLFAVAQTLLELGSPAAVAARAVGGLLGLGGRKPSRRLLFVDLVHNHAASDHRQIGGQTGIATEVA